MDMGIFLNTYKFCLYSIWSCLVLSTFYDQTQLHHYHGFCADRPCGYFTTNSIVSSTYFSYEHGG